MGTNGINDVFNSGFKVKLQNRGPKSSGITFELKSVFDEMAKQGLIKDTDGKGFTKNDALNLYNELNKIHQETNRATNYTTMQVGQQFDYTADEMKALAKAAGYEITGQPEHVLTPVPEVDQNPPQQPPAVSDDGAPDVSQQPPAASQDGVTDVPEQPPAADEPPLTSLPDIQADIEMEDLQSLSLEELRQRIKDNNAENRDLNAEIRGIRKEKRAEDAAARKEMRQEARLEAQQARQEKREARMEARMEQKILKETLKNTEATFQSGGQTGKIVDGKYYINNKEVTKEAFEAAQTKALSNGLTATKSNNDPFNVVAELDLDRKVDVEPFSAEQISQMNVPVRNLSYEFSEDGRLNVLTGATGAGSPTEGDNEIYTKAQYVKIYQDNQTGKYEILDMVTSDLNFANQYRYDYAYDLSLQHAVYVDLLNKQNSGTELNDSEKAFMQDFEIKIADFYKEAEVDNEQQ